MSTMTAGNRTLGDYLGAFEWLEESPRRWTRETPHGQAALRLVGECGDWQQFVLEGGAVPKSSTARVFADNSRLYGPVKFVAPPRRPPVCRADLPRDFPSIARDRLAGFEQFGFESLAMLDPQQAWAAAVTACATGETDGLSAPPRPDERLIEQLKGAGFSASLDDGQLHVHLHMPGLFRQIRLETQDPLERPGLIIVAELLSLEEVTGASHKAALRLARAANERLPLVRLAITEDTEPQVLRAEVHVGCAPVSTSGWLPTALEVVEAAVLLIARELVALRDRELAELVLAADAA